MSIRIRGWLTRCADPMESAAFTLIGWTWYRNGSWSSRYDDGSRLLYVIAGPVLFNRVIVELEMSVRHLRVAAK